MKCVPNRTRRAPTGTVVQTIKGWRSYQNDVLVYRNRWKVTGSVSLWHLFGGNVKQRTRVVVPTYWRKP